jgi:hypothetical protein
MNRVSRATVAVFLGVIVVVGVIVAVVGLGTNGGTAITVGDARLSEQSLNDELRAVAHNKKLVKAVGQENVSIAPGSASAQASASLSTLWIQQHLAQRVLDRRGERITGDDRATALDALANTAFGGPLPTFPSWFQQRLKDRFAALAAFRRVIPDASTAVRVLRREAARAGVTLNPVYGLYHPRQVQVGLYPTPATPSRGGSSSQG